MAEKGNPGGWLQMSLFGPVVDMLFVVFPVVVTGLEVIHTSTLMFTCNHGWGIEYIIMA